MLLGHWGRRIFFNSHYMYSINLSLALGMLYKIIIILSRIKNIIFDIIRVVSFAKKIMMKSHRFSNDVIIKIIESADFIYGFHSERSLVVRNTFPSQQRLTKY